MDHDQNNKLSHHEMAEQQEVQKPLFSYTAIVVLIFILIICCILLVWFLPSPQWLSASIPGWIWVVVTLAIIGAISWRYFPKKKEEWSNTQRNPAQATTVTPPSTTWKGIKKWIGRIVSIAIIALIIIAVIIFVPPKWRQFKHWWNNEKTGIEEQKILPVNTIDTIPIITYGPHQYLEKGRWYRYRVLEGNQKNMYFFDAPTFQFNLPTTLPAEPTGTWWKIKVAQSDSVNVTDN